MISTDRRYNNENYQEACEWFVEFRTDEPNKEQRRRFHSWLQESPANVAAYLDVARSWVHADSPATAEKYSLRELMIGLRLGEDIAVPLLDTPPPSHSRPLRETQPISHRRLRPTLLRMSLAASLLLGIAAAAVLWWLRQDFHSYSTGAGDHRFIVLRDGSMLNLNSRSRVLVNYTSHERGIHLLEGQALFRVAKNLSRPFVVYSGGTQIQAEGTEFDVYRSASVTIVTVIAGRVAVMAAPPSQTESRGRGPALPDPAPRLVSAGEQLTVHPDAAPRLSTLRNLDSVNWMQGPLVFASTPLREVAEIFNRYNESQIVIADENIESFEIDGVFPSTDPQALIEFLRHRSDIEVTEIGDRIILRGRFVEC